MRASKELIGCPEYQTWQVAKKLVEKTKPGARNTQSARSAFAQTNRLFNAGLRVVEGFEIAGEDKVIEPHYRKDMGYHDLLQRAVHSLNKTGMTRQAAFDPELRDTLLCLRDITSKLEAHLPVTEEEKSLLFKFSQKLESESGFKVSNLQGLFSERSRRKVKDKTKI